MVEKTGVLRTLCYIFLLLLVPLIGVGQDLDFSRVVPPQTTTPRTFEDQLVQWAWFNSPGNLVHKKRIEIAAQEVKLTWWEWLSDAQASFNLNEANFADTDSTLNNNLFFPRYNFGLTFNLGSIFSRPGQRKIAQHQLKIAELEEQQQMLEVRAEVLSRYEDYELALQILKSKTQAVESAEAVYTLVEERFQDDKVDFEDYNTVSNRYFAAQEALAVAQANVNKARIALEELIGLPWERAVQRRRG